MSNSQKAHIFRLSRSFFNSRVEGWDNEDRIIVFNGINIHELNGGSQVWEEKVKELFPDHIFHDTELSIHRGQLEWHNDFEKIKTEHPDLWRVLTFHFQVKEKHSEVCN